MSDMFNCATLRSNRDRSLFIKHAGSNSGNSVRSAFTLLELLIVIAIISVLTALLLPTIRKVRYQAQETACMSNLREVGVLLNAYAVQNNGWYPKNGSCRNDPYVTVNGSNWDILTPILKFGNFSQTTIKGGTPGRDIFRCPLVASEMVDTKTQSSYSLFIDTWAHTTTAHGAIADGPNRVVQYGVNGQVVADGSSLSQNQTNYWPYLDERKLMRRLGQTWTGALSASVDVSFAVVASDRAFGQGVNTNRSRQTNHPDPRAAWAIKGNFYEGSTNAILPMTSANYLVNDGSVIRHQFHNLDYNVYWSTASTIDGVYALAGNVSQIPKELRVK